MRMAPVLLMALAVAAASGAEDPKRVRLPAQLAEKLDQHREMQALRLRVFARASELRPRRRDTPMRYVGISDNEMREVQLVAREYVPRSLVNFSPIVTGCPCEEGPQCTDQLYILASNSQTTVGLQLVRIKDTWSVGAVQKWWLKLEGLESRRRTLTESEYDAAELALLRTFPACLPQSVSVQNK